MTYEQPSSLAFSIKESVWLNQRGEIGEILSLALEPDISIHEEEDQVLVRGSLQLFGEYRQQQDSGQNETESFADQVSFRSVEEVSMTDDGVGMIRHSFPLDVTIPKERIVNLHDIYVTVDDFDYELPGRGCIELEANISVSGIKNERSTPQGNGYQESQQEVDVGGDITNHSFNSEYQDSRVNYNEYQYEKPQVNYEPEEQMHTEAEDERSFHFESVRPAEEEEHEEEPYKENVVEEDTRFAGQKFGEVDAEEEPVLEAVEEEVERDPIMDGKETQETRAEPSTAPNVTFSSSPPPSQGTTEDTDTRPSEGESDGVDGDGTEEPKREENALYLTKMLTKGEEEFSKLKMCIVQEGETLEIIAERYQIQVSQLVRMNRLNDQHVSEGEILYIPVKKTVPSDT
ncbi:stage VI sporulation protein D [Evansella tamaricis]|uniref:Stage VI sporulation protein D n=1 Tax=Evansella tamaricis TaxID=2069301 RepID=A0ABS6JBC5_9BACI|nr:stage VI sporulation protein D [Evansella tamaricis]MBU9710986.1 stage VI sporulation protein D [Evansella tamaricis]